MKALIRSTEGDLARFAASFMQGRSRGSGSSGSSSLIGMNEAGETFLSFLSATIMLGGCGSGFSFLTGTTGAINGLSSKGELEELEDK
mmetsp:Transcript_38799/g.63875  ORF Transcript_38799/g.63875 Transcript_38799/m.63875 type:complete len:88 (+) Transcript_38799:721-984(+)